MAGRGSGGGKGRGTPRPGARTTSARASSARTSPRAATGGRGPSRRSPARSERARPAGSAGRSGAGTTPAALSGAGRRPEGSGLWRWGVIALAALVLVVLLAPTVRSYFAQRSEIAALERQVAQGSERVAQLEAEQERWKDSAYVEQQARERLKFVRPGEVSYTVLGADQVEGQQVATGQVAETRPWYDRVWASIGQADRSDSEPAP